MNNQVLKQSNVKWLDKIPASWTTIKIKWLTSVKRGASPRPIDDPKYFDENGEYAWVRIADVTKAKMYLKNTQQRMSKLGSSLSVKREPGDLFLSIAGTVGKPCITHIKCCIHDGFVYFPDFKGDTRYLYYIFDSGEPYKGLGKMGTQLNLNTDTVGSIELPNIPLYLQTLISDYLDKKTGQVNNLIEQKEKLIGLLEERRQSIITEAVTKGLNPNVKMKDSGVEWIGDIPEQWGIHKIKHVAEITSSNVDKKSIEGESDVLLCNYVDVYYNDEITGRIEFMKATAKPEQIEKFTLKRNDVLITKDSEAPNDIAIPTWVAEDLNNVVCGYHLSLIRPDPTIIEGKYLYYAFRSDSIREQFYSRANGVTRFGLPKEAIKNGLVPLPPLNEQNEIIAYLNEVNLTTISLVNKINLQIQKLKEYRQSLIYEAVTGKIDVRDFEVVS